MNLNPSEKNAKDAIEYLLWAAKVKVTSKAVTEGLCLHPDFPSMAAVSDALSDWNVDNLATRLHPDQIKEIPLPALAYLKIKGGLLAPIKSVKNESITWLDTQAGWQTESLKNFQQKWDGVTLLIEPNEQSGEIDYAKRKKEQWGATARKPFLIGGTLLFLSILIGLFWGYTPNTNLLLLSGLKLVGSLLSGLLLWQTLDSQNPFLQNFCQIGNSNNCNSILQSNAAKLTPWLSWSDIGNIYFSGGLLGLKLSILAKDSGVVFILAVLSSLALPYTLYSLYYQKVIANQWCKLCMAVQVTLWLEGIWVFINYSQISPKFSTQTIALLAIAFLLPSLIWVLLKSPMIQATQVFGLRKELQKLKFSEGYVQMVFQNQRKMPPIFKNMNTVQLGNPEAPHILTVVTNPLCGPCAKMHIEINQLIEKNNQFQTQFIFLGPNNAMRVANKFLEAPASQLQTLMNSWYHDNRQDTEKWLRQYPFEQTPVHQEQFRLYARWCELANITSTPTVFINGVLLPGAFQINELGGIVMALNQANNT